MKHLHLFIDVLIVAFGLANAVSILITGKVALLPLLLLVNFVIIGAGFTICGSLLLEDQDNDDN